MPSAMAPAIPSVLSAEEAKVKISPLIASSMVWYKLLPGTNGIIEIIKKVVAGTLIIRARDSLKIEATIVAINTCAIVFSVGALKQ